jgi:hypothetical protein
MVAFSGDRCLRSAHRISVARVWFCVGGRPFFRSRVWAARRVSTLCGGRARSKILLVPENSSFFSIGTSGNQFGHSHLRRTSCGVGKRRLGGRLVSLPSKVSPGSQHVQSCRRLTRPLNLTRPVPRRHSVNFQALVFCRVKAAQVSGKTLGDGSLRGTVAASSIARRGESDNLSRRPVPVLLLFTRGKPHPCTRRFG